MGVTRLQARKLLWALVLAAGTVLTGCARQAPQSILDPRGPVARIQSELLELSMYAAIAIGAVVSGLLLYVVLRFRQRPGVQGIPKQIHGSTALEIAWTLIPIVILVSFGVPTVKAAFDTARPPVPATLTVKAIGNQWWFGFEYVGLGVTTANEMVIPTGNPIQIQIESNDVIHSFWIPKLAGKTDMIPGRVNSMWVQAEEEGMYFGQCAEFCGTAHANMRFRVRAVSPQQFDAFVASHKAAAEPTEAMAVRGKEVFMKQACVGCHSIAGTQAKGTFGPNLSNIGARPTLGAGTLENNTENLKAWIRNPQQLKPGNKMPAFGDKLSDEDLSAVAAYLQSLK